MTFYLLDTRFILFSGFPSNIFCLEKDIFSLSCLNFLSTDFCTLEVYTISMNKDIFGMKIEKKKPW